MGAAGLCDERGGGVEERKKKEGGTETILRRVVRTDRYFTRCLVHKRRLGLLMFLALDPGINVACISILFVG